ncbi:DUF4906 domain-containing protein [uncultured Alistipes sp.]|uniref:DUF4906 domain-containing protein n=1 Tax=uncultured Alistipes sp. TaxID=538949 RepID=UPI002627DB8D|nr:DUF4906 domain-containing protein [uncultured Alistipes sp.]
MNNRLLILTLLAALSGFWGCASGAEEECAFPSMLDVRLTVRPEGMTVSTRLTDETAIRDLNFYLCDKAGEVVLHRYQSAATLRFECPPGDYTIYAVANMHRDMGALPPAELAACAVAYAPDYAALPMAGRLDATIRSSQGAAVELPPLELRRRVAKVAYHIAVAPADIELHSMRVCSIPKSFSLFDDGMPPAGGYADMPGTMLSGRGASGILYLPPNAQGTNPAITDPRLKNRDNAPDNATYLLIRATRGEKVLAYRIYLGENATSDFNVRPNTSHTLDITIRGDNEVDTRISSYILRIWDDLEEAAIDGYCMQDDGRALHLEVEGRNNDLPLRIRIDVEQGDATALRLNGASVQYPHEFSVPEAGAARYGMEYCPDLFDETNARLVYTVTASDAGGFSRTLRIAHRFANVLYARVHDDGTEQLARGSIEVRGALVDRPLQGTRCDRFILMEHAGCTLTAVPRPGYRFVGWYRDPGLEELQTSSARCAFQAEYATDTLYACFVRDKTATEQ